MYNKGTSNYRFIKPETTYLPDKFVFSLISQIQIITQKHIEIFTIIIYNC